MVSMSYRILFPIPYRVTVTRLRQQLDEAHLAWAKEWKQQQDDFVLENIRFTHDPLWNKRIFSIQAAHDGEIWFWRAAQIFVGFELTSI